MNLDIAITVPMAIDNALADATAVVIVHPYQEKTVKIWCFFCSRFVHGYFFAHSSGYGHN